MGGRKLGNPCERLIAPSALESCVITSKIVVPTLGSLLSIAFMRS